jgi:Family of unknown function (DUF6325)
MAGYAAWEGAMSLGPLEFLVLTFPGQGLAASVQTALDHVTKAGDLRVVDALLVKKDRDGNARAEELTDTDEMRSVEATFDLPTLETFGLISEADVAEVATVMEPDTTVMAMLVEHLWAKDLADTMAAAGGSLLRSARIPREHVEEAVRTRASRGATS